MVKESPLNMFHSAAKKNKNPGSAEIASTPPPSLPKAAKASIRNPIVESMLDRMNQMRGEIDDKIEALTRDHNISNETIRQYLGNPNNFTKEQWEFLQEKNHELSQKIWAVVEPISSTVALNKEAVLEASTETHPHTSTPGRKGKFVGSRRKWISTR